MQGSDHFDHLKQIFFSGVERVDPYRMLKNHLSLRQDSMEVSTETFVEYVNLGEFERIIVIGAGKATAKMAKAVEEILGPRINEGLISVKYGHTEPLYRIKIVEAGHPVPDENSLRAARRIEEMAARADEKTLCILLISGGGSALLTSPVDYSNRTNMGELRLEDIQKTTSVLLACGATIDEINCIRKHLSRIKGGRLARLLSPAKTICLILSDVVGDRLDTIASGLTTHDASTFSEALQILYRYEIQHAVPEPVVRILEAGVRGDIEETPKQDDPAFTKVTNILIGTNYTALLAATKKAVALGYHTAVISSQVAGEAREVAKVFFAVALDIKRHGLLLEKPACVIAGGETTVTLRGKGKGGRNQEIALSFLSQMKKEKDQAQGIYFLSASTDGNDGPTDAAGAFASMETVHLCTKKGLNMEAALKENDSYTFFSILGALLITGPTNTNVCDIHIILVP
jgi:hydroxypyruvate reductase